MSASLIDRVRERSGGVLGDTEVSNSLRVLQTELTGAGILEPLLCADGTTDVLVTAPDAVWVDGQPTGLGTGRTCAHRGYRAAGGRPCTVWTVARSNRIRLRRRLFEEPAVRQGRS
jgi:pilus assembly protein CpaF